MIPALDINTVTFIKSKKQFSTPQIINKIDIAFAIFTSSRTFTLSAPTESVAQEWIKALLDASSLSAHRCEEELGLEPNLSAPVPIPTLNRHPGTLPSLDTSVASAQGMSSAIPYTGISPVSARRTSTDAQRVVSFESSGGYFSGPELSDSPPDNAGNPGPATVTSHAQERDRQSFETDELEGLAEDRVVAQGYLLCLKIVSGVRQWKRRWMVLRGRSLTLYKNFEVRSYEDDTNDRSTSHYE